MVTQALRTRHIVRVAARRRLFADTIWMLGRTLGAAMLLALMVIAAGKVLGLGWATWVVVAVAGVCGLAAGLLVVSLRRTTMVESALWLDRRLGLHERLSSALALSSVGERGESKAHDEEFVRLVVTEAEEHAREIRPRSVTPIRADWTWLAWPTAGAAALAVALFVPALTWQRPPSVEELAITTARTQAAERVARAADLVRDAVEPTLGDVATAEELEAIEQLERELTEGKADPSRASAAAAKSLQEVAQRLDEASRELAQTGEQIASAAGNAADSVQDSRVSDLARALEAGDLEQAREAARELMNQARELSPQQREELARDLERLAEALSPEAPAPTPDIAPGAQPPQPSRDGDTPPPPPPSPTQAQQDPSQPEQPSQPQTNQPETSPPEAAQPQPESSRPESQEAESQDGESSPRDAQRPEGGARRPQDKPGDGKRDLSDSMRRLAEEMRGRPPQNQQQPGQDPSQQPGEQSSQQPGEQPSQQPGERPQGTPPSPQPTPGAQPDASGQPQPGHPRPTEQPGQTQPGQAQPGQQPQPGTEPLPGAQPGQQPQPGGEQSSGQPSPQTGDESSQPGGQRPAPSRDAQGGGDDEPQPAAREGDDGESSSREGPGGGGARGRENLEQVLDRLSRDQSKAREAQRRAEDMRETARELLENASPHEREAMERWALEKMRERSPAQGAAPRTPWRPETETFDARPTEIPPDAAERVVARWFSDEGVDRSGAVTNRGGAEAVREAREGAERAIDQQIVPRRHADLVRRVFQRYAERTGAPPPAIDAPDAGPSRP